MILGIALCLVAVILLWAGGYLWGVRQGRQAREALLETIEREERRTGEAEVRAHAAELRLTESAALREELRSAMKPLAARDSQVRQMTAELKQMASTMASNNQQQQMLKQSIERGLKPLQARDGESKRLQKDIEGLMARMDNQSNDDRLRRVVEEAIRPVMKGDRIGSALAQLPAGKGRGDLHTLLTAVSKQAGFSLVALADEGGLLLANSDNATDPELRAGLSSLASTLADSYIKSNVPAPTAVLVHDSNQQTIITRIFTVDQEKYLLTAMTRDQSLPPTVLDSVVDKVQRLMADWTSAQVR